MNQPLLIDEVCDAPSDILIHSIPKAHRDRVKALRHSATRFVFTERAARLMGRFTFECPELLLANRQFAIPPFERATYVELPSLPFFAEAPVRTTAASLREVDQRIGYLCLPGGGIYCFAGGSFGPEAPENRPIIGMTKWHVVPPGAPPAYRNVLALPEGSGSKFRAQVADANPSLARVLMEGVSADWLTLASALGTTFEHIEGEEQRQSLTREIGLEWLGRMPLDTAERAESCYRYLWGTAGDVRNLWAMLLWLNRPAKTVFDPHPGGARLVRGKRVAWAKHQTVDIDLGRIRLIKNAIQLDYQRESPVQHKVRGAFHHSGGDVNHGHHWPLIPDDTGHWVCNGCGRKRWWVKDHVRGDPEKGRNFNDYEVSVHHA